MKPALLFMATLVAVGCHQPRPWQEVQAETNQRLNCWGQGRTIENVQQVKIYRSRAVEVFYRDAADHYASVFLSPTDRETHVQLICDLPEGHRPWAQLEPQGALLDTYPVEHDPTFSCKFNLKVHVNPGTERQLLDNR